MFEVSPGTDEVVQCTVSLVERLFPPPRPFVVRLWEGTELAGERGAYLVLRHPGTLRRMLTPPIALSLGEAFIYGDFDIEGDIFAIFPAMVALSSSAFSLGELSSLLRQARFLPRSRQERSSSRGPARLRGPLHSRSRDQEAIRYHYDVGNAFYGLWLDRYRQYSCAYFEDGTEELDTAQERKLEHICRKLRLKSGEQLLDIGCGWGGLVLYATREYGVQAVGVTLSEKQAEYARECLAGAGLGERARVELRDYRDVEAQSFDKIVSVGMFEHVGRAELPRYFAHAYRLLWPGGLFLNHGISRRATPESPSAVSSSWHRYVRERILGKGLFTQRYVFPDSELMPVSAVNLAAEQAGLEVRDVENLREHYALTLRQWVRRLEAWRAEAVQQVGDVTYRVWRLYMAGAAQGFEQGRLSVNQTLLPNPDGGSSNLPLTRSDLYA
jgi:cyclopropane-fatty-acyl-phospholipid synthase